MEQNEDQSSNSNYNKSIDFVKLSKDDLVHGSKMQEQEFFSLIPVGSLSCLSDNNNEGKYENKKDQPSSSNSKRSIDFVQLSKYPIRRSKVQEYDFFSPIQIGSSSGLAKNKNEGKDGNKNKEKSSGSRYFSCSFCKGKYSSLQALGGHQNAHRVERSLQRKRKQRYDGSFLSLGQPQYNPYFKYPSTHFTPYNYGVLGIRMDSTIQKQPYINPRITSHGFGYGYGALSLQEILNPSLVRLRNNIEGSHSRFGITGMGGATTSSVDDATKNNIGAVLQFGDSSTNIGTSTNSNKDNKNIVASTSTMNDIHKSKSNIEEEPSDSTCSGLDLTLKL